MRATFAAPVGDLGLILLISTTGQVLAAAFAGMLIRRLGVPVLLVRSDIPLRRRPLVGCHPGPVVYGSRLELAGLCWPTSTPG
jgi:hypothetical protein